MFPESLSGCSGICKNYKQPTKDDSNEERKHPYEYFYGGFKDSELVIGLVYATGTNYSNVVACIKDRLNAFGYNTEEIHVSRQLISDLKKVEKKYKKEYERINSFMDYGNELRKESDNDSILSLAVAGKIYSEREIETSAKIKPRTAYIILSLKHPDEVERLREIYSNGFFLIGVYSDEKDRKKNLIDKQMTPEEADKLIHRDMNESEKFGQHTRNTYQMADFFVELSDKTSKLKANIYRILDLIFGSPYITPTFDEYAMFMAFASSLRSADLSRQVGSVITKNEEIIASGANDCPKYDGGLYWSHFNEDTNEFEDFKDGRDYTRGYDSNKREQQNIVENIAQCLNLNNDKKELLKSTVIKDITEYGRIVHAEMESLLMCARNNVSTRGATLYCTTFPCHNCAKHIIASGIEKVYYVEPYPKSKALVFHDECISEKDEYISEKNKQNKVLFLPFIGVGPKKFFDLFSISLSSGYNITRKDSNGDAVKWRPENASSRFQLTPFAYTEKEMIAYEEVQKFRKRGAVNE